MYEQKHLTSIGIQLASPEAIIGWGHGEVKKPETINYRTQKPEPDGLFCERIFGPVKSWECHCGKYKKIRYRGMTCDRCGVEVTKNTVRRTRMGYIVLATPVSHIWYFKGQPGRMSLLLDLKGKTLENILYYVSYVVIDPGETDLVKMQTLDEQTYREYVAKYGRSAFSAKMGAEAIKELLQDLDLQALADRLREEKQNASVANKLKITRRLEVVESFLHSGNKPEWMILDVLPVLPPELRPMVPLDGGRYATSDLNDLYRRVITRNNRLKKLLDLNAPDIIVRNEKRMLQEAVDSLIDNGRRGKPVTGTTSATSKRELKSLTDNLKGKQGRFRQNLLGKRVDYSGRSVIVVGPELKMHQCGLPKEMALELFKPFVIKKLVEYKISTNVKTAKREVEKAEDPRVWDVLEEVIMDHPVMLNRAPTLHRLGIQAFEPILVEGRAIKLHPLVCTAFNADFDGDQMAVHVPLSAEAQAEARFLMLSSNNLLKPQDGKPVTVPTQDMVLGCFYLTMKRDETMERSTCKGDGMCFTSLDEAFMAYDEKDIELHSQVGIRVTKEIDGKKVTGIVRSTFGRFIFNQVVPQDLGYVDRKDPANALALECDFQVGKKQLGDIIARCIKIHGTHDTAIFLDEVKTLGYKYSTRSGISIGIADMIIPKVKDDMIKEADERVEEITQLYDEGLLSDKGRHKHVVQIWKETTENITEELKKNLKSDNPIKMMSASGARGNDDQIKQLAGMRGNMADTSGETIEIPIKSNLREGMNVLEFFISSHGARKALSDTALKTADSGYLTRKLEEVSQQIVITEEDCGTDDFTWVKAITTRANTKEITIKKLRDRLDGRYAAEDIKDLETGEILVHKNELISTDIAERIEKCGYEKVKIRSVFDCHSRRGVCSKCYGINLANGLPTCGGEAVGIMAAQSIGEPGTQLTMRTFHTGGIANSGEDITQGLPRVKELFEASKPKSEAKISEIDGIVRIEGANANREIIITPTMPDGSEIPADDTTIDRTERRYAVPLNATIKVKDGEFCERGEQLIAGTINPSELLRIKDERAVQKYILSEVVKVYHNGGVSINDKHIEIITRQMLRKFRIDDPGDTKFLSGTFVDMFDLEDENARVEALGMRPATGKRELLGIKKATSATESFLAAASFEEAARALTDAAVKGKRDNLIGLKENVIIGSLIPAGTGAEKYRDITAVPVIKDNYKVITGKEYSEDAEDASEFENDFYEALLEEEAAEAASASSDS